MARDKAINAATNERADDRREDIHREPAAPRTRNGDLAPTREPRHEPRSEVTRRIEAGLGERRDDRDDGRDAKPDEERLRGDRRARPTARMRDRRHQESEGRGGHHFRSEDRFHPYEAPRVPSAVQDAVVV